MASREEILFERCKVDLSRLLGEDFDPECGIELYQNMVYLHYVGGTTPILLSSLRAILVQSRDAEDFRNRFSEWTA